MFLGRKEELEKLQELAEKKTSSLIVMKGRRRIGKSSLLKEFGSRYGKFYEIIGLAPRENLSNQEQLENFSEQLTLITGIPGLQFNNWTQAFEALAKFTEKGKVFILLDEISWMGGSDKDFLGKLKIAWDRNFSKNPQLMLAICGSVSSWIDKNILNDTDFIGRISYVHKLGPLPINIAANFWNNPKISEYEKIKILSITGGIPKYLEEINTNHHAEKNIANLCFEESGYLYQDFKKIFNDIFDHRANHYQKIIKALLTEKLTPKDLADKLNENQNSDLTEYITDLEQADFLAREYTWNLMDRSQSKLSTLRIKDNYVRFYLKYIEPNSDRIKKRIFKFGGLKSLPNWEGISGHLFEGLVLDNVDLVFKALGIPAHEVTQYGPFFQTRTKKRKGCQVDLLIQSQNNYLYVCELKYREKIGKSVIEEVEKKIKNMEYPKNFSIRPILIYVGEMSDDLNASDYFVKKLDFTTLLK